MYQILKTSFIGEFFLQTFSFREYLVQSVLRDLRTKYKRSVLGYVWTMLHPLGMMAVLAIVFSHIMRIPIEDYAIFLFAGLLPWNYFNSTAIMALGSIRRNASLFGQIPLPKYIFVLSIAFSNLINYLLALIPLVLLILLFGRDLHVTILAFPIVVLPITFMVIGISMILAVCNVFFDDTAHLAEVLLQALYFLCPVLYHRDLLPANLVTFLELNPIFVQIEHIRGIFYYGVLPDPTSFLINFTVSLLFLAGAVWLFEKNEEKFLYFI